METLIALLEFYNTYDHKDIFFKVAEYVLFHTRDLEKLSLEELADRIPVSESTMNRFIKRLAFNDFSAVRGLSESVSNAYEYEGRYFPKYANDDSSTFAGYGKLLCRTVTEVTESVKRETVEALVQEMLASDKIIFIGAPMPYNVWRLQAALIMLGKNTNAFIDPNYQMEQVQHISERSIVFGMQIVRPSDRYLFDLLEMARSRGAKTALVTNVIGTKDAAKADFQFVFSGTYTEIDMHLLQVILSLIGIILNETLENSWRKQLL